ncbi:MAG: DUF2179 domain-containing protein [Atopococcus tabaci]|uniref:UPF0316 protein Q4F26_06380 n=1 Tax=Atopococcus tabaci TaxID=269774 RepID=A0AA43UDH9_9LACT|nr:DUF2179 domain-containing protein [Atopococcus tabaci]
MNWSILLQIFTINLLYITLNTIRVILTMRGYRRVAPVIAVIEVMIYTVGLSMVMQYLSNPIYLVVYALGFGIGIYTGMMIEDRMALGYSVIYIIADSLDHTLADGLRQLGYGVTIQVGYGRDGERLVLTVLTPRSTERKLYESIDELSPTAFYYSSEAKYIRGGFWTKKIQPKTIVEPTEIEEMHLQQEDFMTEDFMSKEDYQDDEVVQAGEEKESREEES